MKRTCKRKKAFLGAIIGAVTSIAGSAISAASQRKAQEKQIKRENYINRNQSANNLSTAYSNEEYVDDFLNKTTFKYGGNKTMACGNRKTAEMGISERYKKQLEQREKDRKVANAVAEQKRREANARRVSAQRERATYMTKLDTEAKKRQETKKRLSAKNTKPFPYNSPFVRNYANEPYNISSYAPSNPVKVATNTQKSVTKPTSSTNRATITSTKRPVSPVTQTRTAVKRNTNTTSIATRNNTNATKGNTKQTTITRTNTPAKASTATNRPAQRTTQRTANASTQRSTKSVTQNTNKSVNAKPATNKATTTKTTTQSTRQNTDNKLTFARAFASARKAGKQTFNWDGKSYTTQLAGETNRKKSNPDYYSKLQQLYKSRKVIDAASDSKELIDSTSNNKYYTKPNIPSPDSIIPKSSEYYDRINMMKCGGKRKMKCGGKCKRK